MAQPRIDLLGGIKSVSDFSREAQEFEARKRKRQLAEQMAREGMNLKQQELQAKLSGRLGDGTTPATIKIANEMQKALDAGDTARYDMLNRVHKTMDKGIMYGPTGVQQVPGYGAARSGIASQVKGAEEQAKKDVQAVMDPQIKRGVLEATEQARVGSELKEREASLPQLKEVVSELRELAPEATYSLPKQAVDWLAAQSGYGATEGAEARSKYTSIIDNEIIPLLRQTFGAQFTQQEGESLKNTLGDPDKTPEEKQAVLDSFIQSKMRTIRTQRKQLDMQEAPRTSTSAGIEVDGQQSLSQPVKGEIQDGYMFNGGNPADPKSWKKVR